MKLAKNLKASFKLFSQSFFNKAVFCGIGFFLDVVKRGSFGFIDFVMILKSLLAN
jgi:hypothetical protein